MNFQKYENKLSYPQKPVKPIRNFPTGIFTYEQAQEVAEKALRWAEEMKVWEAEMKLYYDKLGEYQAESNKLYSQFKQDALIEVGLAGHPKAEKVFAKAWEDGHSSGYSEVFSILEDLAELVL